MSAQRWLTADNQILMAAQRCLVSLLSAAATYISTISRIYVGNLSIITDGEKNENWQSLTLVIIIFAAIFVAQRYFCSAIDE